MTSSPGLLTRLTHSGIALVLARLIVGVLMVIVSVDKLRDPVAFLKIVKLYEIVPVDWHMVLNSIAVIVPWIELIGGVALLLGLGLGGTGGVICLMLIGFTAAIALRTWNVMQTAGTPFFQVQFDCGCGTGTDIIWIKLIENTGLILLSWLIVFSKSRFLCLSTLLGKSGAQQALPSTDTH